MSGPVWHTHLIRLYTLSAVLTSTDETSKLNTWCSGFPELAPSDRVLPIEHKRSMSLPPNPTLYVHNLDDKVTKGGERWDGYYLITAEYNQQNYGGSSSRSLIHMAK